ncbi:hypothetical protein DKX38_023317 [Salix brachista]|uniref:Uncharacterized protein n=1 Tax=Salix brachista TaxID=2182728 RepID=A0A5N5JIN9_9ROSI|nr:hypothetical protein DKX38_023317 [Salix brachista]
MVRKETVLVAFMACLLLVASFTVCTHATEGRRMLASEKVYYPQGNLNSSIMLAYPSWLINAFPLTQLILGYLKVVAAVSSSEGYQTSAVEMHAALPLAEGTAASGRKLRR